MGNIHSKTKTASLRREAEELLKKGTLISGSQQSLADMEKLVHELAVHQIELELQNEELILAKEQTEITAKKYTELFEYAPSGYFSLSNGGTIVELNLTGSQMLGKDRSYLLSKRFGMFVTIRSHDSISMHNQVDLSNTID